MRKSSLSPHSLDLSVIDVLCRQQDRDLHHLANDCSYQNALSQAAIDSNIKKWWRQCM